MSATTFPPGAQCFTDGGFLRVTEVVVAECPTTPDMIDYLNLTESFIKNYFPAYCINPPGDDGCPYGYCPNPDITGPLVRISTYITNFLVAILVFHDPDALRESFWSQLLTVYSLLITSGTAIIQSQLTRIHAIIAISTAGSPLSLYIAVYAIRSMWNDDHRLAKAVGPHQIMPRLVVITALGVWIALLVYILLPSHLSQFTQRSCDDTQGKFVIKYFYVLPFGVYFTLGDAARQWEISLPLQVTIIMWIAAIWCRRAEIWPPGQRYTFRFWKVWRVITNNYPFIRFLSVVVIPFLYWLSTIEIAVLGTNDHDFTATFGQVLAMFVTIPPIVACVRLLPRLGRWFVNLTWVRYLACRTFKRSPPSEESILMIIGPKYERVMRSDPPSVADSGAYDRAFPITYNA